MKISLKTVLGYTLAIGVTFGLTFKFSNTEVINNTIYKFETNVTNNENNQLIVTTRATDILTGDTVYFQPQGFMKDGFMKAGFMTGDQ